MIGAIRIPILDSVSPCGNALHFNMTRIPTLAVGTGKARRHQNVRSVNLGPDGVNPLSRMNNLRLKGNRYPVGASPECRGSPDSNSTSGKKVP